MKRIVILGGKMSGIGSAVLAKTKGFDVFLSDNSTIDENYKEMLEKYDIPYEQGGHTRELIFTADEVIKSPGIPDNIPIIEDILRKGIPVISEIEFAGRYDKAKKICITGSNGKTTTTSIIYYLLKNAGFNVGLAGNIGQSYALQVATEQHDIYVLELSSFQLDGMYDFKADIAILLNITPDHLDRYDYNMLNYIKAKFRITRNMSEEDCFIFCNDDQITISHLNDIVIRAKMLPFSQQSPVQEGGYCDGKMLKVVYQEDEYTMPVSELSLKGRHNIYNTLAAAITGKIMKISNKIIRESLASFIGVEHRLENICTLNGVQYINDSKATNVNSTWYALECMNRPVVWIAGGKDKGNDYSPLYAMVKEKVKALICLGVDNKKLHDCFEDKIARITDVDTAEAAARKAQEYAQSGDIVLLSPCCASFDLFKSYEDRGEQFKNAVKALK